MAQVIIGYPFTSQVTYDPETDLPIYDRAVGAEVLRNINMQYWKDGVFSVPATSFQVTTADGGLSVVVLPGSGTIYGTTGYWPDPVTLPIEAPGGIARTDAIVLRWDENIDARALLLDVVKGDGINQPQPTRTDTVKELILAYVSVRATATQILTTDISDQRLNTALCGLVRHNMEVPDTDPYFEQIQAYVDYLERVIQGLIASTEMMLKTEYAPDGTAQVVDGTLTVESEYPHPSDNYAIVFEKPNVNLAGEWSANAVFDGSATELVPLMVSGARDQSMNEMPDIYFRRGDKAFSLNGANFTNRDITLYVNPATGTPYGEWDNPDKPFNKIETALATIPRILRNVISVVLAPGYYDNYEYIGGLVGEGGYIDIIGAGTNLSDATSRPTNSASVYSVFRNYIQINRCSCTVQMRGIFFQDSAAVSASRDILAQNGSAFYVTQCVFADGPGSKTTAIHTQSWARGLVTNSDFRYRATGLYLDTGSYLCGNSFTVGAGVTTFATCNRSTANIGLASSSIVVSQSNGGRVFTNYN